MRVNLKLHGGPQALMDVLQGLVVRNERAIRLGELPMLDRLPRGRVRPDGTTTWQDGPSAFLHGKANAGSIAAWAAASERAKGKEAHIALVGGIPSVWVANAAGPENAPSRVIPPPSGLLRVGWISPPSSVDLRLPGRSPLMAGPSRVVSLVGGDQGDGPSQEFLDRSYSSKAFIDPLGMALSPGTTASNGSLIYPSDYIGGLAPHPISATGSDQRVDEQMELRLDDPDATPIREIGDAIAIHNAKQILAKNLPPLYHSGVRYETEPHEIWKDYPTMIDDGVDDCEGFAAVRAGELLNMGYPAWVWTREIKPVSPEGVPFPGQTGMGRMFHAVTKVLLPDGRIVYDDPSIRMGGARPDGEGRMPVPDDYIAYARRQRAAGKDL